MALLEVRQVRSRSNIDKSKGEANIIVIDDKLLLSLNTHKSEDIKIDLILRSLIRGNLIMIHFVKVSSQRVLKSF
ncbi:hypothetical protein KY290_017850 [Solanum tuberosum]|uniref:Uncharacterized protein n=1 Tax=Solanum tuberosum TaxID=4113 RepID=A0ABQ7VCH6_SOLTU|nr:hypothetical protein KY290_017850 [Solanum tuberosum]